MKNSTNRHEFRESWLHAAVTEVRPHFESEGYRLPDKIRIAIGFTSTGRKGKRRGECWDASTSDDASYEIFIRADLAEPLDVLAVLVKELVHTVVPVGAGHGKLFKAAALKIGLQGPMRCAVPSVLLRKRLTDLATSLGPLPHASLHTDRVPFETVPIDRPKKQNVRMLKAECEGHGCGYSVRLTSKWVHEVGPPHCPKHGAMAVNLPAESGNSGEQQTQESV